MRGMSASPVSLIATEVLLCDADGNLFPSEEPAFDASVTVVNDLMRTLESTDRFTADALREATTGQNFRHTAGALASSLGRDLKPAELEQWVSRERREVTSHLAASLTPNRSVTAALTRLQPRFALSVVSSSALARVRTCMSVCGLSSFFERDHVFSAEDSLPVARSKPHPDIYLHALAELQIKADHALAIEDSVPGVQSAVAAGIPVLGNVVFVSGSQRTERSRQLRDAGAMDVFDSWEKIADRLLALDRGRR
jgi:beta-phosphoglucomutase-like phosphatase (HAD superfamily)